MPDCEFTRDDMRTLLDFLNTIAIHTVYIAQIDNAMREILNGSQKLFIPI